MNVRLLLVTVALAAVVAPTAYLWYRHRLARTSDALLARAEELEQEQSWSAATNYYQRCMLLDPDNTPVLLKMVEAYSKQASTPAHVDRLNRLLYQALGRAPERDDLRRMLAENLLKSYDFARAQTEAEKLSESSSEAAAAKKVIALSLAARARADGTISIAQAVQALLDAAAVLPGDVQLISVTATTLRENPTAAGTKNVDPATLADQLMDQMVANNPDNPDALVARYLYRSRYKLPQSESDLQLALKKNPDHLDALLLSAAEAFAKPDQRNQVEDLLRHCIEVAPNDPRAYIGLAELIRQEGDQAGAVKLLQRGYENAPDSLEIGIALVGAQLAAEDVAAAKTSLRNTETKFATYLAQIDADTRARFERQLGILQARLLLADGQPQAAQKKLQLVALSFGSDAASKQSADWFQLNELQARISAGLGQWDRAVESWNILVDALPGDIDTVQSAAKAFLAAGDPDKAAACLDRCARVTAPTPDLATLLVQAHLAVQLKRPVAERNWAEFLQARRAVKDLHVERPELVFADVEYLLASSPPSASGDGQSTTGVSNRQRAASLLHAAEERFSKQSAFWRGAASAYHRLGESAEAERALARCVELEPSAVERARVQAGMLAADGKLREADELLVGLLPSLTPSERRQIEQLRVSVLLASNDLAAAQKLVGQLIATEPEDATLLAQGIEISLETGDLPTAEKWEAALRKKSPESPESRYLRARVLLASYDRLQPATKQELSDLITGMRVERPRWYPIIALAAQQAQLQGDTRQALADYRLAVDLGDRRLPSLQQLVSLLYASGGIAEAQEYIARLATQEPENPLFSVLAIDQAVSQNRLSDAIVLARRGVEQFPNDPMRPIWLANLLVRDNRTQEAVDLLRTAATQFSNDDRIWNALFVVLVQDGQHDEARHALDEMVQGTAVPADVRHFVAAQGYELLGDAESARQQYQQALARQPEDLAIRLRFARFLLSNDIRAAEKEYEEVLRRAPDNAEARQELAGLLAVSGQEGDWERATRLLQGHGNESTASAPANDRLRAILLAQHGRTRAERIANCQTARQILQPLIDAGNSAEGDINRLLLAKILEQEANLSDDPQLLRQARDLLQQIVKRESSSQQELLNYLDFLLRHATRPAPESMAESVDSSPAARQVKEEFLKDAESCLADLNQVDAAGGDPSASLTRIGLTVRLLKARGQSDEAAKRLADYITDQSSKIRDDNNKAQLYLMAGGLYATLGKHAESEKWYRQLMDIAPNAYVLVVQSLIEQGKRGEAVGLCLNLAKGKPSPKVAIVLTNIMSGMDESDEKLAPVRDAIEAAIESNRGNIDVLQAEGVMRASRGEYDKAVAAFRRIVKLAPNNPLALNNLATMLAERPNQRAEALQLIEHAIQVAGRQATLLDTKGTVLFKTGDYSQAIACLEEATAGGESDARYYLHLAAAYHAAGRNEDALRALQASRDFGLEKFVLTDDDRRLRVELEKELGASGLRTEVN